METRHYISDILKWTCMDVFADICDMVVAGHRPSSEEQHGEFLVVRTSSTIGEHNVYQQASLYVQIYVKNLEGGYENTVRLQELLDKVDEKFPKMSPDKRFAIKNPVLQISGDDQLGYSVWLVRASLQINTTDKFHL